MDAGRMEQAQRPLPDICWDYNTRECLQVHCQKLHVCFWFILTDSCRKEACTRVHDLETPRNIVLLRQMGWCGPDDMKLALDSLRRRARELGIRVCTDYNCGDCTDARCFRLHVCHRHVLDSCPLDDCELSHDVKGGQHNAALLEASGLTDILVSNLLPLLRDHLRCNQKFQPKVCGAFNSWATCYDRRCLRLHCCYAFIRGQCIYESRCFKNHSLGDPHNQRVLRFFGWTEGQVMSVLASEHDGAALLDENCPARLINYLEEYKQRAAQRDRERQQQGVGGRAGEGAGAGREG